MADFTIEKPVPFTVEGTDGAVYELPRLRDLSADQVEAMAPASKAEELSDKVRAVKQFLLMLCPELEDEPLTDMGYMELFNALGAGSDVSMGES